MTQTTSDTAAEARVGVLERFGDNPSAFLGLNAGNQFYAVDGIDGLLPYRPSGRGWWIQFGGPLAAESDRSELLTRFLEEAERRRIRVLGLQLLRDDAELQISHDYNANQIGASYSVWLPEFSLQGKRFVKTRNMVTRSRRSDVVVAEVGVDKIRVRDFDAQLAAVDASWLRAKGRFVRQLRFLVGERTGPFQARRRLFVACQGGTVVAYVSFPPVYGRHPGWLYDLTRRRPEAPPGVIDHVFTTAAQRMREEGVQWLHLGMTPFVGLDPGVEIQGKTSATVSAIVGFLAKRGGLIYPAAGQLAFKEKWQPTMVTPEYVAFKGHPLVRDVWHLARVTNLI